MLGTPLCCPIPTQPRHPTGRPNLCKCSVASTTVSHVYHWPPHPLDCWFLMRAPCCRIPRITNTQVQTLQVPSIIAFQTSHTTCLQCACWRQQQEFIGAVKLAIKNSSHPPHTQLGSMFRVILFQAHISKWLNFSSVILVPNRTIRRSPGAFHLEMIYNQCTVSYHPAHQHMIKSNFRLVLH